MHKNIIPPYAKDLDYELDDYNLLLTYIQQLANHKLGYPVSLLTFLGVVDNKFLGIMPGSLANVLLNNVGDPFKDSETSRMEVKRHERKILAILGKYYGLLEDHVKGYVTTGGTEGNFAGLWWSKRYLINMAIKSLIETDNTIKLQMKKEQELTAILAKIPLHDYKDRLDVLQKIIDLKNAILANKNIIQELVTPTIFYCKDHTHYSVPKAAEILHFNLRPVLPNSDGSINLESFKKELFFNLKAHPQSGIIVVANIGTTITGAIDNVPGIKKILDESPSKPLYTIHMDGALTGFVMPLLKPFGEVKNYFNEIGANTLAVSAHKYPGLSQPCGIILAEKAFFEKAFEKSERSVPYVGNILDVTITGSRSGLNVLMIYNALMTFKLDKTVEFLKKILRRNLLTAQILYKKLINLYGAENVSYLYHFNISFPKPSMALAKKYQLMITEGRATVCVLTNVNKKLIDQFIEDLQQDKERMTMETANDNISIRPLENDLAQSATELFISTFCNIEPATKHLQIQEQEYSKFASEIIQKAIAEKMSLVAVNEQNKVIALIIAEDIATRFDPDLDAYPQLAPILAILNELSNPFLDGKHYKKNKVAHIWIAAVDPQYMRHGIFKKLNAETIKMLANMKFEFAYAEFTNPISENIVNQFPVIELCNRMKYSDFVFDGKKPFAELEGGPAAYVAAIQPNIKFDDLKNCYTLADRYSTQVE